MINTGVLRDLENKDVGFYISKIEKNDHTLLENIVEKHLQNLFEIDYINNSKINFSNYLDKVNQKDHQKILTKKNRVLPKEYLENLLNKLEIFKDLEKIFSKIIITDEENLGFGNFYWRLVRPFPYADVGTMHKDKWFWDLGTGKMNNKIFKRYKLWISIKGEDKLGFKFVPGSANLNLDYKFELKDAKLKPVFDEKSLGKNKINSLKGEKGTFILFNDELLHGGEVLHTHTPRVSIECTFQVKK